MRCNDPLYIFDARLIDRHIKQGLIAESDLNAFVQSLPDRTENAESLSVPFEPTPGSENPVTSAA
ncbi:MAG: hypothetical protein HY897_02730 [Deltaproteobacteria bacterium]|nr:hypothetical protein [Deltaproteobacteria bacterium]